MSTCRASCCDRPGRNPKLHGRKSASKTGSSTIFTAACTIRSRTGGIDNGLCSPAGAPGFGISTRRAGSGRYRPSLSSLASSPSSRATPYSSTFARVILSMPGAPLLLRTAAHARHRTSLRQTLSYSAWNLRPGSALAARYSACCKARTGSAGTPRPDPCAAGLAPRALTRPLLTDVRTDEAAALPITGGYAVHPAQAVLRPPPTPTRPAIHFPGSPVIGRHAPVTQSTGHRAGEGLPSSRRHHRCVPRPIRRGVPHGCASRLFAASMAFALISGARHSLLPPEGETSNDAAGFASCYGPHRRSPFTGLLTLGSGPARFQTEPPACYRASWQLPGPDSHRQATTSLRPQTTYMVTSSLLGARNIEVSSHDLSAVIGRCAVWSSVGRLPAWQTHAHGLFIAFT